MKVTYSPIVSDVRGHLSRLSFYRLNGANIVRGHKLFQADPSVAQLDVRDAYGSLYEVLNNLSGDPLQSYVDRSDLESITLFNSFIKYCLRLEYDDDPIPMCLGTDDSIPAPVITSSGPGGSGAILFSWTPPVPPDGLWLNYVLRANKSNELAHNYSFFKPASAGAWWVTGLIPNKPYDISIFFHNSTTHEVGPSSQARIFSGA